MRTIKRTDNVASRFFCFLDFPILLQGSVHQILDAHCHYVQGVAWDPLSKYVASLSSDRTCRIYVNKPQAKSKSGEKLNYVSQHVITKADQQRGDDTKVRERRITFMICCEYKVSLISP